MSFREMLKQRGDLSLRSMASYQLQEDEISFVQSFLRSQNPYTLGLFALMGLNIVWLLWI